MMSYDEYQREWRKLLAELRQLGVTQPALHYPRQPADSIHWENQLFMMNQHIAEIRDFSKKLV